MRIILLTLLSVLAACASSPSSSLQLSEEADLHLRLGNSFFAKSDYPRALNEFSEANKQNPNNPTVLNNLGLTYFALRQPILGINNLEKAIELSPDYTEARNNLARIYIEVEQFAKAEAQLKLVVGDLKFPEPEKAWLNYGLLEFKREHFTDAKVYLSKALRIKRDSCLAYNYYARVHYSLKEFRAAIPLFEKAIEVCKKIKFEEPLYYSALNLYESGDRLRGRNRLEEYIDNYSFGEFTERAKIMLKSMK